MFPLFSPSRSGQDGCDHDDKKRTPNSHTPFMCAGTSPDSRTRVVRQLELQALDARGPQRFVLEQRREGVGSQRKRALSTDGGQGLRTLCVCDPLVIPYIALRS